MINPISQLMHTQEFIINEHKSKELAVELLLQYIDDEISKIGSQDLTFFYVGNVKTLLTYLRENNKSNDLPYHGLYHTCCVILNSIKVYKGARGQLVSSDLLPLRTDCYNILCLVFAAAFHDFNHSGGKEPDYVNIAEAQKAFQKYAISKKMPPDFIKDVLTLISVTQYPFLFNPTTDTARILRDADLLQISEPLWFETNFIGLKEEIEINLPEKLTHEEFVTKNLEFLVGCRMYTRYGSGIFKSSLNEIIPKLFEPQYTTIIDLMLKLGTKEQYNENV